MRRLTGLVISILFLLSGCSDSGKAPEKAAASKPEQQTEFADTILHNGRIYSLSWPEPDLNGLPDATAPVVNGQWQPDAEAIAIKAGLILAVGDSDQVMEYQGPLTELVDLGGTTVVPGLIDSHTHLLELGKLLHIVDLTDVKDPNEALDRLKQSAQNIPKGEWILGRGWDEGAWANNYPDAALLDAHFPDNPVWLESLHSFALWVNTSAMQVAGIDKDSQAPVGGEILRDESGNPKGIFLNRATTLFESALPKPDLEHYKTYLYDAMQAMLASGYVAVHDAGVDSMMLAALQDLKQEGRLPLRVYVMLSARDKALANAWAKKGPYRDPQGWLDVVSVKAYYDGALGSRGARLLEDYSDMEGHRGVSGDNYGFDRDIVDQMIASGFQISVHAIGDAGNREVLAYFAEQIEKNPQIRDRRHRVEHAQVVHPDDFKYFYEYQLIASMEPPHAVEDKAWAEERLGSERIKGAYAWRTFRNHSVPLALNSDMPGSDHNIFYGLYAAVTRKDKSANPAEGWYIEQALSIEEALRGYTQWSAYAGFRESQSGQIKVGYWADLSVLNVDPFSTVATHPERLLDGKIQMTWIAGNLVYRADGN